MDIKFSIVMPVYNVEKYVERAIDTVFNQTEKNFELIVVNDGSIDKSGEICRSLLNGKSNVKLIEKENGGLVSAWKKGVENAKGEYVVFLDSDDFLENNLIEELNSILDKKDYDAVIFDYYDYKDGVKESESLPIACGEYEGEKVKELFEKLFFDFNKKFITSYRWNKVCKREIIESILHYVDDKVTMYEDFAFSIPVFYNVKGVYYRDKPLYDYCYNGSSMARAFNYDVFDKSKIAYETVKNFLTEKGIDKQKELLRSFMYMLYCQIKMAIVTGANVKELKKEVKKLFKDNLIKNNFILATSDYKKQKVSFSKKLQYFLISHNRLGLYKTVYKIFTKNK